MSITAYTAAREKTIKAALMAGRGLDLAYPSKDFKWEGYALEMISFWGSMDIDYEALCRVEPNILLFCNEELVEFVNTKI